jgi:hypothetical protein
MSNQPSNGRPSTPTQALAGIASQVVDNFKTSPALLAIIVLNIGVLIFIYFGVREQAKERHTEFSFIIERCLQQPRAD